MEDKIGSDAGKVWAKLNTSGPLSPTELSKNLNLKAPELDRAVGWLARESKVAEIRDAKGNVKIDSLVKRGFLRNRCCKSFRDKYRATPCLLKWPFYGRIKIGLKQ